MKNAVAWFAVLLTFAVSCRLRDIRTVTIEVPRLRGEECAQRLHRVLAPVNGVDPDALRFEPGRVTVTYDSMRLALKNIEHIIAEAGFDANDVPADPAARERLPERCR